MLKSLRKYFSIVDVLRRKIIYNLDEELEIANAVAKTVFKQDEDVAEDREATAREKFHQTMTNRALRFLQTIEDKISQLQNQEVANLLKVLLSSGLEIESEEELEYWINLLEQQAILRLNQCLMELNSKNPPQYSVSDLKGFQSLLQSLQILHSTRKPPLHDAEKYRQWKEYSYNLKKAHKYFKKLIKQATKPKARSRSQSNRNDADPKSILESKMLSAGVEPNGAYWNEVMSSFDSSLDKTSFANNWEADQSKIDLEKSQEKTKDQKDTSQKESIKLTNHLMALRGFSNPRNLKIAEEIGNKKTLKTGQSMDFDDIKKIKTQIVKGGR